MRKKAFILAAFLLIACFYACTHKPFPVPTVVNTNNNNTNTNTTQTDTTQTGADTSVCFQRDILPMLQSNCAMSGCHNAASAHKGYIYTSYATIMAKGIVAGNYNVSTTYTEIASRQMPKSPVPAFDSTQLSLLKRWINNGAHDDTDCMAICDTTKFTFASAIVPILRNNCYSCHATVSAATTGGG